ncbi:MAG: hypothetical protein IT517_13380 [Burkholderiales bacterium]|nr:hypothetical protein [Burkholderiales bacterium]
MGADPVRVMLERALAAEQAGDAGAARTLYEQALDRAPDHPGALMRLALLDQDAGDLASARVRFERALAIVQAARRPAVPVLLALAGVHVAAGDAAAAGAAWERVVAEAPGEPTARHGLAVLALTAGDAVRALEHCRAGLAGEPAHAGLLTTLGHALRATGAPAAAADAFGAAARAAPDSVAAWMAAGNACMEAELAQVQAVRAGGTDGEPADALARALTAFARAAALEPAAAAIHAHRAMAARYACDWPHADSALAALARGYADDPARFACSPLMAVALLADPAAQRAGIAGWVRSALPPAAAPGIVARRGDRLRVGYLSSDFHDHATAHLAAGLFEHHDRARVECFAYAQDADDGSAMRRRLARAFDHWRDVGALADDAAARTIAGDALDVLVDLKGHTHGARPGILARRPAPVQLHYLGFPGTLAYGGIDAFVADAITVPADCAAEFAEAVLRLPACYQVNDSRRPAPAPAARAAVGLPERALVLASFNQTYKLTAPFFAAWLDALRAHADAVLWLNVPHELARANLRAEAARTGVAPERIVFAPTVPQAAHVARLACADLALDVLPYGSHTTGSDALWAGVPLLTCRGTTFAGRVGASLLQAVELPELVAETPAAYARMLRDLCADRTRLAHYRRHLEAGRATLPLFDTAAFTLAFERLLADAANGRT